jgi:hypothetical protein
MKIAALQTVSATSVAANLDARRRCWRRPPRAGAELAVLPEYFCLMGRRTPTSWRCARPSARARCRTSWPSRRASSACGSSAARCRSRRRRRARAQHQPGLLAARRVRGALRQDPPVPFDNGREQYDESRVIEPGAEPAVLRAALARRPCLARGAVGLLRPALSRAVPRAGRRPAAGAQRLHLHHRRGALGAAAARPRGREPGLRLRPAQGGKHENGRRTWGHSMVVDPWGAVLAQREQEGAGRGAGRHHAERLAQVRRQLPALAHRVL